MAATTVNSSDTVPSDSRHGDHPHGALRWTLRTLIQQLQLAREHLLDIHVKDVIDQKLQGTNQGQLPDLELAALAAEAIDLQHDIAQRLQPGHLVLADQFFGYMSSKCLVGVVELGVPDALSQRSLTIGELSSVVKARPDRLGQVMRTLRNDGIFDYDASSGTYSNNSRSHMLTSGHWTQWRNWVDLYGNEFYDIARGIPSSLREDTTRGAAQHNYDTDEDMFAYFERRGWVPRLHRTLGGGAIAQAPGILADYPWHELADKTVLDIGGGGGALVASLLREHPTMRGGVFDLPKVIDHMGPFFQPGGQFADVGDRVAPQDLIAGDFFTEVASYEAYTMKWCLHDWLDEDAIRILTNIRRALKPGDKSRLVVLEAIMADGEMGRLSRYGDINMMMTAKGQERSEQDWRRVFGASGWKIDRIHNLRNAWVSAIDLRPDPSWVPSSTKLVDEKALVDNLSST